MQIMPFWNSFVGWSDARALQTLRNSLAVLCRRLSWPQQTCKCVRLDGVSFLGKVVWANVRGVLVHMGLLGACQANLPLSPDSSILRCIPLTHHSLFFMPVAARPRFTQPAKMRRRVIAHPVGSSIRLKCVASGNPRPDITWLKDNKPLTPQEIGENKKKKWTLNLKNLKPEDSGKYTCRVFNRVGEINATYKVEVIRKCSLWGGGGRKRAVRAGPAE